MNHYLSEVATDDRWIDGKRIYRKSFQMGSLPNGSVAAPAQASVPHGIVGLDTVVRQWSFAKSASGTQRTVPYADSKPEDTLTLEVNGTVVAIIAYANWTDHTAVVTLEYTKS